MLKKNAEKLAQATNNNIDTATEFFQTSLKSIEKLTKLHLDASKKFLDETSKTIKGISQVKNPKDLFEKVNLLASNSIENNACNCRNIYEIMTEVQTKVGKLFETQIQATQQSIANAVSRFSKLNSSKSSLASE